MHSKLWCLYFLHCLIAFCTCLHFSILCIILRSVLHFLQLFWYINSETTIKTWQKCKIGRRKEKVLCKYVQCDAMRRVWTKVQMWMQTLSLHYYPCCYVALQCITPHRIPLHCIALHCNALQYQKRLLPLHLHHFLSLIEINNFVCFNVYVERWGKILAMHVLFFFKLDCVRSMVVCSFCEIRSAFASHVNSPVSWIIGNNYCQLQPSCICNTFHEKWPNIRIAIYNLHYMSL